MDRSAVATAAATLPASSSAVLRLDARTAALCHFFASSAIGSNVRMASSASANRPCARRVAATSLSNHDWSAAFSVEIGVAYGLSKNQEIAARSLPKAPRRLFE